MNICMKKEHNLSDGWQEVPDKGVRWGDKGKLYQVFSRLTQSLSLNLSHNVFLSSLRTLPWGGSQQTISRLVKMLKDLSNSLCKALIVLHPRHVDFHFISQMLQPPPSCSFIERSISITSQKPCLICLWLPYALTQSSSHFAFSRGICYLISKLHRYEFYQF